MGSDLQEKFQQEELISQWKDEVLKFMNGAVEMSWFQIRIKRILILAMIALTASMLSVVLVESVLAEDWDSYKPVHVLGSGESDWWFTHPSPSGKADLPLKQADWITSALKDKPLVVLVHSSSCRPCVTQMDNMEKVMATYGSEIEYRELLGEGSGLKEATELLINYSTSGKLVVPTTVFFTLIKGPDGKAAVAWHSVEDVMSEGEIGDFVKDAIYYYRLNSGS